MLSIKDVENIILPHKSGYDRSLLQNMVLKRIAVQVTMLIIMSSGFTEHKFPSSPRRYMRAWYGLQRHYPDFSSIGLHRFITVDKW